MVRLQVIGAFLRSPHGLVLQGPGRRVRGRTRPATTSNAASRSTRGASDKPAEEAGTSSSP